MEVLRISRDQYKIPPGYVWTHLKTQGDFIRRAKDGTMIPVAFSCFLDPLPLSELGKVLEKFH